tara:strand:+ start:668 stop:1225 length:558 start_codon:yes stop_codon:yes gene_type:complete
MKKIIIIFYLLPLHLFCQKDIEVNTIIEVLNSGSSFTKIFVKTGLNGELVKNNKIKVSSYDVDVEVYKNEAFKFYNGLCDNIAIYLDDGEICQFEMSCQRMFPSLKQFWKGKDLKLIQYRKSKPMNRRIYLFQLRNYAVVIYTVYKSEEVKLNLAKKDDILMFTLTPLKSFNKLMSESYGIRLSE